MRSRSRHRHYNGAVGATPCIYWMQLGVCTPSDLNHSFIFPSLSFHHIYSFAYPHIVSCSLLSFTKRKKNSQKVVRRFLIYQESAGSFFRKEREFQTTPSLTTHDNGTRFYDTSNAHRSDILSNRAHRATGSRMHMLILKYFAFNIYVKFCAFRSFVRCMVVWTKDSNLLALAVVVVVGLAFSTMQRLFALVFFRFFLFLFSFLWRSVLDSISFHFARNTNTQEAHSNNNGNGNVSNSGVGNGSSTVTRRKEMRPCVASRITLIRLMIRYIINI